MILSARHFRRCIQCGVLQHHPPWPLVDVDLVQLAKLYQSKPYDYGKIIQALMDRAGFEYFFELFSSHINTMVYAGVVLPGIQPFLIEGLNDEWLGIVDWRKYRRDHAMHQPMTAYAVEQLLNGGPVFPGRLQVAGKTLLDWAVDAVFDEAGPRYLFTFAKTLGFAPWATQDNWAARILWRFLFRDAAYFAAMFHDVGFAWQYATSLTRALDGLLPGTDAVLDSVFAASYGAETRLMHAAFNGYQWPVAPRPMTHTNQLRSLVDDGLSKTHGLPGALGLIYLGDWLEHYPRSPYYAVGRLLLEWAALAVFMHDVEDLYSPWDDGMKQFVIKRPYLRLIFKRDPLSTLLKLSDEVQEFGRTYAQFMPSLPWPGMPHSDITYKKACVSTQVAWDQSANSMWIRYRYIDPLEEQEKLKYMAKTQTQLFAAGSGFVDMGYCGINNIILDTVLRP